MDQKITNINESQTLYLGRRGENAVTEILFDISELQLEYGPGTVELLVRQPSSNELYPIVVTIEKNFAKWRVRLEDVSVEGTGEVQLSYFVEKQCKKTTVYRTYISKSLGATTSTPDPGKDWVNHIIHIGASVEGEYKKAESYAHCGTGTREGEDTDNAKYYAEKTKQDASQTDIDAKESRKIKEQIDLKAEEIENNRASVEQTAQVVKKSEQNVKQSEQNVIEKEQNVVALEGNVQEAKGQIDTATAEVDKNAKEVAANKDIVVKAEQNIGNAIAEHNVSLAAHEDIRGLISGITARIDAVLDSDDVTLDQLSEIVAYIKSNKSLIEQVTTNKVNVSDIINNLTTNDSNKPLSAAMGVELKRLIAELNKALFDYVKKSEQQAKDNQQDEAIKKNTESIIRIDEKDTEQDKQIALNKESVEKLLIKETEKGKAINLSDSAEFPFVDYKVFGHTEQVTTTGKNLFDKNSVIDDFYIDSNTGEASSVQPKDDNCITDYIYCDGYKFFYSTKRMYGAFYNDNKDYISGFSSTSKFGKFNIPENARYIRVTFNKSLKETSMILLSNDLIDSEPKYEPYTGGKPSPSVDYPQEMIDKTVREIKVTGINLLKQPYPLLPMDRTINGVNAHINDDYSITLSGTATEMVFFDLDKITDKFTTVGAAPFTSNGYSLIGIGCKNSKVSYTSNNLCFISVRKGITVNETVYPMITLEANKDKPYELYKEQIVTLSQPITLAKWDRIEKRDGVWGVVKNSKIINSSQYTKISKGIELTNTVSFNIRLETRDIDQDVAPISDKFLGRVSGISSTDEEFTQVFGGDGVGCFVRINKNRLTELTVDAFKQWLASNEFKMLYKSTEETFESLPLVDQQALEKLHTFYPNTVVMTNEPCEQELTYVADSKNYIDKKLKEIVTANNQKTANLLSLMPLETQASMIENDTNNILSDMEV